MSWKPELDEIARRKERAAEMGGEERVARHVEAGRGDQSAIIYDSAVTDTKRSITYAELRDQVSRGTMKKIADGSDYPRPATIEDASVLPEIAEALGKIWTPARG